MSSSNQFISNLVEGGEGNVDLGTKYVTKSYLIDVYPFLNDLNRSAGLFLWGKNLNGQIGNNSNGPDVWILTQTTEFGINWKQGGAGSSHSLAIKTDGTLWSWGFNTSGQLGDNSRTSRSQPVQTTALGTNWNQVSCGTDQTSAVKTDGTLWTWGSNTSGQLGDNTRNNRSSPIQTITFGTNWKKVVSGSTFNSAIKTDGTLWVWGDNTNGQLGDNTITPKSSPVQTLGGDSNWKQVSISVSNAAGIKTDGTLWTWGSNSFGQLGDFTITNRNQPVQTIALGTNWQQVSCGYDQTSAIKTDGTLWTWGRNSAGQLGDSTRGSRSSPIQTITGGTTWQQVSCGYQHTAAIKTDGTLWTWGRNSAGQLGDSTTTSRSSPVQTIALGTTWRQVSAGKFFTSSVKKDGTLWTWGLNNNGQLGDSSNSSTVSARSSPVQTIAGGTTWQQVSVPLGNGINGYHVAAIKTDGTLWTWGLNNNGQLGDSTRGSRSSPVQTIALGTNWKQVSAGSIHTVAVQADGTLWTWGFNNSGQLGDNTNTAKSSPVQTIARGTNWDKVQIAAGGSSSMALKTDGTLWSWGNNASGQLGDNSQTPTKLSPIQVLSSTNNWKDIASGGNFSMALKTDGTLWTWGFNDKGQLGNDTQTFKSLPVQTIALGKNWKTIECGDKHCSAIKTDGTLWTWGFNGNGQLGNSTQADKSSPIQTIAFGTNWKQVSCGNNFTSAIKTDGTLWTWGDNANYQLGVTFKDSTTYVPIQPIYLPGQGTTWKFVNCGTSHMLAIEEFNDF